MRPMDKATANSLSVQSFSMIKNTEQGNFVIGRFQTTVELEMDYPFQIACVQSPPPPQTPLLQFFPRGGICCTQAI